MSKPRDSWEPCPHGERFLYPSTDSPSGVACTACDDLDDPPRPPDEYEQVGWTCSTGPISQARIFVAQVKPGPPAGSMAWEPVYVKVEK